MSRKGQPRAPGAGRRVRRGLLALADIADELEPGQAVEVKLASEDREDVRAARGWLRDFVRQRELKYTTRKTKREAAS